MMRKLLLAVVFLVAGLLLPGGFALAAKGPVFTGLFSNVAVGGHDVVAYFTENRPVRGDKRFSFEFKGAAWHFASAVNRDLFVAGPERYAPQYGGYCAWAVSEGSTASADPAFWKIVDRKLYLNYDAQVQKKWENDIAGHIRKADRNWPGVLGK